MTEQMLAILENRKRTRLVERCERWQREIQAVEARKGELPKRELTELQNIKRQIDTARTERQTIKTTLDATRTEKTALRATLQAQLDAATGAEARRPIREQLDAVNAELQALRNQLDESDATLEALRLERAEILLQERIAKGETTPDDEPEIERRKELQASDTDYRRAYITRYDRNQL